MSKQGRKQRAKERKRQRQGEVSQAKAPAIITSRTQPNEPTATPLYGVKGPELVANIQRDDFPRTLRAYVIRDEPHMVEYVLRGETRRVLGSKRLVIPAGYGTHVGHVVYIRVGGDVEIKNGVERVYAIYELEDPRDVYTESSGVALGRRQPNWEVDGGIARMK